MLAIKLNVDVPVTMPTTLETALPTAAAAAPSVVALLPSPCAGWGPVYSAHWRQTDFGGLQYAISTKIQMHTTHMIAAFKQPTKFLYKWMLNTSPTTK